MIFNSRSGDCLPATKYSSRLVNNSYSALFHAIELKKLMSRFANVDMRAVAPDARAKWLAMLREHASAGECQTSQLRTQIHSVFFRIPQRRWLSGFDSKRCGVGPRRRTTS
jgi:hypothetical protein